MKPVSRPVIEAGDERVARLMPFTSRLLVLSLLFERRGYGTRKDNTVSFPRPSLFSSPHTVSLPA
eukprot:4063120-Prorocentrum_lima.AAC.1